jgi:hypothetical protein
MTLAKRSALFGGFIGAVVLGVLIGPFVTNRLHVSTNRPESAVTVSAPVENAPQSPAPRVAKREKPSTRTAPSAKATREHAATNAVAVDLSAPELHKRLKPVLNRGANMSIASEGFRDAEQFATIAHAARNTNVPFLLLKHRVLDEGKTLQAAIRESKPELDVAAEAARARDEAKQDLASVTS